MEMMKKTPLKIIRQFIRKAEKFGYDLKVLDKSRDMCYRGSVYVAFSRKGSGEYSFIFRFSDHLLNYETNQVPAGVIQSYVNLNNCLRLLWNSVIVFESLNVVQIDELWQNRHGCEEFEYLNNYKLTIKNNQK